MIKKSDKDSIADYLTDASCFEGSCNDVYIAENIDDIKDLLKKANNSTGEKLTISAAGTGLTGSRVPLEGNVLSMENFNKILDFSVDRKTITLEPFVRLTEIQDFLRGSGLFYPPNPTEKLASIGGNIGNNASGSRTYAYGATRKYVQMLGIILPTGDSLDLRRGDVFAMNNHFEFVSNEGNKYIFDLPELEMPAVKHAAGYFIRPNMDLIDLFIGAEGTLGVIHKIELSLLDEPESVVGAIIFFDKHDDMYKFLETVKSPNNTLNPRLIEFFDNNSLDFLKQKINGIPPKAHYALWIEVETTSTEADQLIETLYTVISEYTTLADDTWIALNDADHRRLAEFRHALPLAVYEKIQEYKQQKLGTDTAVPDKCLKSYHEEIISLFEQNGLDFVIWGHIGNAHFHANIITKNSEEFVTAKRIFEKIVRRAIELGGTVSAEHGIGKIKKEYLAMLYDEKIIEGFREIKRAIDPNSVLNIGNIFDV